jgi:hypothetical protein
MRKLKINQFQKIAGLPLAHYAPSAGLEKSYFIRKYLGSNII